MVDTDFIWGNYYDNDSIDVVGSQENYLSVVSERLGKRFPGADISVGIATVSRTKIYFPMGTRSNESINDMYYDIDCITDSMSDAWIVYKQGV